MRNAKKVAKQKIRNAIVISDGHTGDQLGLCPPEVPLNHGGTYHHSKYQAGVWECWEKFKNECLNQVETESGIAGRLLFLWAGQI